MVAVIGIVNSLAVGDFCGMLAMIPCFPDVCRSVIAKINHDSHLLERTLELIEERLTVHAFASHLEQEAHARMARVHIKAMFTNDFIVCIKKRPEWESIGFGLDLSAGDNLVEKADICSAVRINSKAL